MTRLFASRLPPKAWFAIFIVSLVAALSLLSIAIYALATQPS